MGRGGQLGSCWNSLIRDYGSWNRVVVLKCLEKAVGFWMWCLKGREESIMT